MQVIGATTLDEYREDIESDPALERRFQKILVEPASEEETLQILHNIAPHYERHHGVRYSDEALRACVALTGRYITDRNFPDKAIDVLDEAGARIHLQDKGKTEKPSRKTASREPVGAAAGAKTPKTAPAKRRQRTRRLSVAPYGLFRPIPARPKSGPSISSRLLPP